MTVLEKHSDHAALVGRILFASMFLLFGYGMLTHYGGSVDHIGSLGLPAPSLITLAAIVIEIVGGLLMLVGYQTRLGCARAWHLLAGRGLPRALPARRFE